MGERINKKKAEAFVKGLQNANPTADAFQRIKSVLGVKSEPNTMIMEDPGSVVREGEGSNFHPDSFKTFSDTNLDRQKADAVLNQLRNQRPQPVQAPSAVSGDIQALMDQAQDLETRQEFEPLDQDDTQKLQRIKEMLRTK